MELECKCGFNFRELDDFSIWDSECECPTCGCKYEIDSELLDAEEGDWGTSLLEKEL